MELSTDLKNLLPVVIAAALEAGEATLDVYNSKDFEVEEKADHSPLTLADKRSHEIIVAGLKETGIPVLSEEGRDIAYDARVEWDQLWIIDPLDGTKEFIKKNDEFTVNIALVKNHRPVLGVIYVPVIGTLYFAAETIGAFFISQSDMPVDHGIDLDQVIALAKKLPLQKDPERPYTIMGSRSHATPELAEFVEEMRARHQHIELVSAGSSLKFCHIAEGKADIYPRMGPTMEWDTAAGQVIAEQAGAVVYNYNTHIPLQYNKSDLLNPWFVVERS